MKHVNPNVDSWKAGCWEFIHHPNNGLLFVIEDSDNFPIIAFGFDKIFLEEQIKPIEKNLADMTKRDVEALSESCSDWKDVLRRTSYE